MKDLCSEPYEILMKEIEDDIKNWKTVCVHGKINIVAV